MCKRAALPIAAIGLAIAAPYALPAIGTALGAGGGAATAGLAMLGGPAGAGASAGFSLGGISSFASIGLGLASTVFDFMGQRQANAAAAAEGRYLQAVALRNAELARRDADRIKQLSEIEKRNKREETARLIGLQKVGFAANGVDVSINRSGGDSSVQDILGDTAAAGELDVLTIDANTEFEVANALTRANNFTQEGQLAVLRADGQQVNPAGTLLAGAGRLAGRFSQFRQLQLV